MPYQSFINTPSGRQTLFSDADFADLDAFHAAHRELSPTPLRSLPGLARALGIGALLIKDETSRYGLPAFKSLGARYAIDRLRREGALGESATVACASAGNHGRAVARAARDLQLAAHVYLARDADTRAVSAIEGEGAVVHLIDAAYEDAVRQMAADANRHGWTIVSDTSWPGYEVVPHHIMLGYTRLVTEWATQGGAEVDLVVGQGGVGGLVCGIAGGLLRHFGDRRPRFLVAEPSSAECLMASARAGRPTALSATPRTIMAGLRCAEPSPLAVPTINAVADAFVTVEDDDAREAITELAGGRDGDPVIEAGPSGACGVAALLAVHRELALGEVRDHLQIGPTTRVLAVVSEHGRPTTEHP